MAAWVIWPLTTNRIQEPCGCVSWDELKPSGTWIREHFPCWRHREGGNHG